MDLTAQGTATILGPDGVAVVPSVELSAEDAQLLRAYKTFLQRHGLREALYCNTCWSGEREDGCEAHVTVNDILIKCRCRLRFRRGAEY